MVRHHQQGSNPSPAMNKRTWQRLHAELTRVVCKPTKAGRILALGSLSSQGPIAILTRRRHRSRKRAYSLKLQCSQDSVDVAP
jgi:hypothetical protein